MTITSILAQHMSRDEGSLRTPPNASDYPVGVSSVQIESNLSSTTLLGYPMMQAYNTSV